MVTWSWVNGQIGSSSQLVHKICCLILFRWRVFFLLSLSLTTSSRCVRLTNTFFLSFSHTENTQETDSSAGIGRRRRERKREKRKEWNNSYKVKSQLRYEATNAPREGERKNVQKFTFVTESIGKLSVVRDDESLTRQTKEEEEDMKAIDLNLLIFDRIVAKSTWFNCGYDETTCHPSTMTCAISCLCTRRLCLFKSLLFLLLVYLTRCVCVNRILNLTEESRKWKEKRRGKNKSKIEMVK